MIAIDDFVGVQLHARRFPDHPDDSPAAEHAPSYTNYSTEIARSVLTDWKREGITFEKAHDRCLDRLAMRIVVKGYGIFGRSPDWSSPDSGEFEESVDNERWPQHPMAELRMYFGDNMEDDPGYGLVLDPLNRLINDVWKWKR